jgi:broad specificity phosphatase PhoE/SAM-dependent methyltransferase
MQENFYSITATTPMKKLRRRLDGSPILVRNPNLPSKRIFLIRHGESMGQAAAKSNRGWDRQTDSRLIDCGLTRRGTQQAQQGIRTLLSTRDLKSIELVVSSPLTRALHTALLAFPDKNILVGYDLREIGSKVPENTPRKMKDVLKDSAKLLMDRECTTTLDVETFRPPDWPRDYFPAVVKRDRIRKFFECLYHDRTETTIAVVCHYNVIRSAVTDGANLRPANAVPIPCLLHSNGDLVLASANAGAAAVVNKENAVVIVTEPDPPIKNEFSIAAAYYNIFRYGRNTSRRDSVVNETLSPSDNGSHQQQQQEFWTDDVWTKQDEEEARQLLNSHLEKCTISSQNHTITPDCYVVNHDANAWDHFYIDHGTRFFKDRHYLEKTFPEEFLNPLQPESTGPDATREAMTLVEIGCGVGNSILPLTEAGVDGRWDVIHGLDISQQAIKLLREDIRFVSFNNTGACMTPTRAIFGHVCDVSQGLPSACFGVSNVTTLLFCLSAIDPSAVPAAVKNIASTLKAGGRLVFRDYGRYDEAQMKLGTSRSKCIKDNFYRKHDGTKCFYFTVEEVEHLFGSVGGLDVVEVKYLRRIYENKGTGQRRRRVWVQGRFQKAS